jgi:hypothetical protein
VPVKCQQKSSRVARGQILTVLPASLVNTSVIKSSLEARVADSDPRLQTQALLRQGFPSAGCRNGHQNGHQFGDGRLIMPTHAYSPVAA